jgi:hypothetical protein
VWLYAYFTHPGPRLVSPPAFVILPFDSWTPARGGWAFARLRTLRIESGKGRLLDIPAAEYVKRPVRLFDTGRREMLAFRIDAGALSVPARRPEPLLQAGNAQLRLRGHGMTMIRELFRRMTTTEPEAGH